MSIISAQNVFLDCPATTVDEVLDFFADKAVEAGIASDKAAVLAAFKEREAMGTTGMTGGFAIPHAKCDAVKEPAIMVAKLKGVKWESMDGAPITTAIALFMPGNDPVHLRTLAKVAGMLMNEAARVELEEALEAEAIAATIYEAVSE